MFSNTTQNGMKMVIDCG